MQEEKRRKLQGGSVTPDGRPSTPVDAAAAVAAANEAAAAREVAPNAAGTAGDSTAAPSLPKEEVIRRLRALGQPVTLFGEEDTDRQARLRKVEKTVALVDETRGGQQENVLLMLKRQEKKLKKQQPGDAAAAPAAKAGKADAGKADAAAAAAGEGPSKAAAGGSSKAAAAAGGGDGEAGSSAAGAGPGGSGAGDDVLAAFQAAAERLAAQRAEEALPVEERITRMLQRWCKEWEQDLEGRSEEVSSWGGRGGGGRRRQSREAAMSQTASCGVAASWQAGIVPACCPC